MLFFAGNGFYLCTDIEPSQAYQRVSQRAKLLATDKMIANQKEIALFLKNQLAWVQKKQTH